MPDPTFRMVPLKWLKPYSGNARVHSEEQIEKLAASIKEFGFNAPVIAAANGDLIAGHARVEAAKSLGMTEVPCVIVQHLNEEQRRAYILADNRISELGAWDFEILNQELDWLFQGGFDTSLAGFEKQMGDDPVNVVDEKDSDGGKSPRGQGGTYTPGEGTLDIVLNVPAAQATAVKRWLANGEYTVSVGYGRGVMRRMGLLDCKAREGYAAPGLDDEDLDMADDLPEWLQTGGPEWQPDNNERMD